MKIWKKLLQVDRVNLEFIGNAIYAIAALLLFTPYKFSGRMMIKFRITKEKEKEENTIKRPQQNVEVFFFQ